MTFLSLPFLIFIFATLLVYYLVPGKFQWVVLLAASYVFYLYGGLTPLFYILSTTVTVYLGGLWMERNKTVSKNRKEAKKKNKKILLGLVIINFGILLLLKYYNFFAENVNSAFSLFKFDASAPLINIVLPLGISFYTFQAIGYAIDVYRNKITAERYFLKFALFISFFPQIIQGPISRFEELSEQLFSKHRFSYIQLKYGAQLFLWGCFKKMMIADRAGTLVAEVFGNNGDYDGLQTCMAILIYAIQIYADFSGGIDMARGVAQMLDIDLPQNFKRPYFGTSVAEYWRRWHMTLTNWMRDYVFYPLTLSKTSAKIGKWSRKHLKGMMAKQLQSYLPTFITFFLIGVWHGASWGFIVFGLCNASIIVLSMAFTPVFLRINQILHLKESNIPFMIFRIIRTFLIMAALKCIVRATSVGAAFSMIWKGMHCFDFTDFWERMISMGLSEANMIVLLLSMLVLLIVSFLQEMGLKIRETISKVPFPLRWLLYLLVIAVILVYGSYGPGYDAASFIYRNF